VGSGVVVVDDWLMKFVISSWTFEGVTLSMQTNAGRRMTVDVSWWLPVGVEVPLAIGVADGWWTGMFEADSFSF